MHGGTTFPLVRWLQLLEEALAGMPEGIELIIHRLIAEGEWAVAEVESRGYLSDGRLYNMPYTFWLRFATARFTSCASSSTPSTVPTTS